MVKQFKTKKMKKKNLLMTAIAILGFASITIAQTVPSYVPTNGLVGWWPFTGNANDESGNGHNGNVIGASLSTDRFNAPSSCYEFLGQTQPGSNNTSVLIDNVINIPNYSVTFTNQITISVWANIYTTSNSEFLQRRTSNNIDYAVGASSGVAGLSFGSVGTCSNPNSIVYNSWHQIVYSYDGNMLSIYTDGVLGGQQSGSGLLSNNTSTMNFGKYIYYGGLTHHFFYNGKLDDIGIWNRALSQQEITALYNSQSCNSTSNTITTDGPTTFCAGNSVNLKSDVEGGTYQWKKNGVNVTSNGTSRTYKATATGSYTCVATCSGTVLTSNAISVTSKTNASATVSASGATSFCAGDSVTLNATNLGSNYSVQWYRTNISMENATAYSQVVKQPGTYKVVTKNLTTGCSRISGSAITTNVNCPFANSAYNKFNSTSDNVVNEKITGNDISDGISIYPNPNNGTFVLEYEGEQSGSGFMQVVNSMGQTIYESNVEVSDGLFSKEVKLGDNISKGIYIVRLSINGSSNDSRIIVK
jgi:hypothetical protein